LIGKRSLNVTTYRSISLYFQLQSVLCAVSTVRCKYAAWLELRGAVPFKVLVVSKAETVSVMTDFLVFINEFTGLCC
jgi:hypothetical protein